MTWVSSMLGQQSDLGIEGPSQKFLLFSNHIAKRKIASKCIKIIDRRLTSIVPGNLPEIVAYILNFTVMMMIHENTVIIIITIIVYYHCYIHAQMIRMILEYIVFNK